MKMVGRGIIWTACALVCALMAGCGGVNASGSVSPASFFLPGIIEHTPERPAPADVANLAAKDHS